MDLQRDAARLATIATVFVWVGWISIAYALIAGLFWWIDLWSRPAFNVLEGFEGPHDAEGHRTVGGWKVAGLPWRQG